MNSIVRYFMVIKMCCLLITLAALVTLIWLVITMGADMSFQLIAITKGFATLITHKRLLFFVRQDMSVQMPYLSITFVTLVTFIRFLCFCGAAYFLMFL